MKRFRSGNVVRLAGKNGSLVIITGYRHIKSNTFPNNPDMNYEVCDYVFVNFSNSSGCTRIDTTTKTVDCINDYDNPCSDYDCEDCKGTGDYNETSWGMDEAVLVASCVKDWITDTITNKFNF